jgi:hypothetical protein
MHDPGYTGSYGAINAAAGHHNCEGRWLKTGRYLDDYQAFWLRGPGQDQAHQYSFWAADSFYAPYLVNADRANLASQLPSLDRQYDGWGPSYAYSVGLYWPVPV